MKLLITDLIAMQPSQRPNFFSEVMTSGEVDGEFLIIDEEKFKELCTTPLAEISVKAGKITLAPGARPGSLLSVLIRQLTGQSSENCPRCQARVEQMNEWGWIGCAQNLGTIVQWLVDEARARGRFIDGNTVRALVKSLLLDR